MLGLQDFLWHLLLGFIIILATSSPGQAGIPFQKHFLWSYNEYKFILLQGSYSSSCDNTRIVWKRPHDMNSNFIVFLRTLLLIPLKVVRTTSGHNKTVRFRYAIFKASLY